MRAALTKFSKGETPDVSALLKASEPAKNGSDKKKAAAAAPAALPPIAKAAAPAVSPALSPALPPLSGAVPPHEMAPADAAPKDV